MDGLEIVYEDATLKVGVGDNLTVARWTNAPTLEQMRTLDRIDKKKRAAWPGGVAFLNVVADGVPKFSADVREEAARQTAQRDGRDLAAAHLILVDGFAGVAVRAFISTITLMGKARYPTKVFGDRAECARWLAPRVSDTHATWTDQRVLRSIDALL